MSPGLAKLREMALAESRRKHPDFPESARYVKPYSDKSANGLTRAIIDFLRFNGCQAERIMSSGRYIDNSRVVTNIGGARRRIGSGRYIPTSGVKGSADVSATIKNKDGIGLSIKIEIKMMRPGYKDRQSLFQKAYQESVERAGGNF